jgi:DNA uptake protein ComE-like DNA-binding protein
MNSTGNKKGLVLVGVLWVVVVLLVIAAAARRTTELDTKMCWIRTGQARCKWACRAGLETATAVLNTDLRASDCLTDTWSDNDADFNDVALEGCWFDVRVEDEASKLNVNTATREQLMGLEDMTEDIADAIIDWRDEDEIISPVGAEGGYYVNLSYGYRIRNGPFKTIRELLKVKNVAEDLFYGEDTNFNGELDFNERDDDKSPPADNADDTLDKGWIAYLSCHSYDLNTDAGGNERTNINDAEEDTLEESLEIRESYAKWIVDNRPDNGYESIADLINDRSPKEPEDESDEAQPLDLQTFSNIADKITVNDDDRIPGMVNINTAPREVLAALSGGDEAAWQLADQIIAHRKTLASGMVSIAEVLNVKSVTVATFKKIANYVTTRSNVFTVRCVGTAARGDWAGSSLRTEMVVERSSRPCKILYWYQGVCN